MALCANPVPRLLFRRSLVTSIDNRRILKRNGKMENTYMVNKPTTALKQNRKLTVICVDPTGRICPLSGTGSLSGQYMIQGAIGSVEIFLTLPPVLNACPDGVNAG